MPNTVGTQLARSIDWIICKTAKVTFNSIQHFNKRNPNPSVTPQWSDKPLLKSWEKSKPTLGFPRQTDSLCPGCVKEAREAIIAGKKDWRDLGKVEKPCLCRSSSVCGGMSRPGYCFLI